MTHDELEQYLVRRVELQSFLTGEAQAARAVVELYAQILKRVIDRAKVQND